MATKNKRKEKITSSDIARWEKKVVGRRNYTGNSSLTRYDRYNYKLTLPEDLGLQKFVKTSMYATTTDGSQVGSLQNRERLMVVEGLLDEKIHKKRPIVVSKKFAKKNNMLPFDNIEILKIEESNGKIKLLCSDTTKNENPSDAKKNLKSKKTRKDNFGLGRKKVKSIDYEN